MGFTNTQIDNLLIYKVVSWIFELQADHFKGMTLKVKNNR